MTEAGRFDIPPSAMAVVANVTAVSPSGDGFVTVFPAGQGLPTAASLNVTAGSVVSNLTHVGVGSSGAVSVYSLSATDAVIDVQGYVVPPAAPATGAGLYDPLAGPVRVCDTRGGNPSGLSGPAAQCNANRLGAGATRAVGVAPNFGVPVGASAVVANITAVGSDGPGYLTAFPAGKSRPTAATLSYGKGQIIPNRVIVPLGAGGVFDIYSLSATDVVVDISGYYTAAGGSGSTDVSPASPTRICDTRSGNPSVLSGDAAQCNDKPIGAGGTLTVTVAGHFGVPGNATAVIVNIAEIAPTAAGYLTVFPGGVPPTTADLTPAAGQIEANLAVATLSPSGTVTLFNSAGTANVAIDLAGWTAPPEPQLAIVAGRNRTAEPGLATATPLGAARAAVDSAGSLYIADPVNQVVEKVTPAGALTVLAGTVGKPGRPTPGPATSSHIDNPNGVAVDTSGNVYIIDSNNIVIEKVTPAGVLSVVAGTVGVGGPPRPGPATTFPLNSPTGVATDAGGDLYIADTDNEVVEKVTPAGTLSIFAGTGTIGPPIPGPATSSSLDFPSGLAVDTQGALSIADEGNNVVEKVTPAGALSVVAGTGTYGTPTPGPATGSKLAHPTSVAVDTSGNLSIADPSNNVVERVTPAGTLSIAAGIVGTSGTPTAGPATSSHLYNPAGVAVDRSGDLYIVAFGYVGLSAMVNSAVEKVTPAGTLSVVAGTRTDGPPTPGPAASSDLGLPKGVAVAPGGDLYIADTTNQVVEKVTPTGTLSIVAGTVGTSGTPTPGPATKSHLGGPVGVAVDTSGNLYIADAVSNVIEKVTPGGALSIVAGIVGGGPPTPGPATSSHLSNPDGVTVDTAGNLSIADSLNRVVEKVTAGGSLSIAAGDGTSGAPTPGPATSSHLGQPTGVAVDRTGDLYIGDFGLVEKVTPGGVLSVVAGGGGNGPPTPGPATKSGLGEAAGLAVDGAGNLYIADTSDLGGNMANDNDVVKVTPGGTLSIVAGNGSNGPPALCPAPSGPPTPGPVSNSELGYPSDVAVDATGNLYIADTFNSDVEKVTLSTP